MCRLACKVSVYRTRFCLSHVQLSLFTFLVFISAVLALIYSSNFKLLISDATAMHSQIYVCRAHQQERENESFVDDSAEFFSTFSWCFREKYDHFFPAVNIFIKPRIVHVAWVEYIQIKPLKAFRRYYWPLFRIHKFKEFVVTCIEIIYPPYFKIFHTSDKLDFSLTTSWYK